MMFVEIENLRVKYLGNDKPSLIVDRLSIEEGRQYLLQLKGCL